MLEVGPPSHSSGNVYTSNTYVRWLGGGRRRGGGPLETCVLFIAAPLPLGCFSSAQLTLLLVEI